jgi:hypothetical protein
MCSSGLVVNILLTTLQVGGSILTWRNLKKIIFIMKWYKEIILYLTKYIERNGISKNYKRN